MQNGILAKHVDTMRMAIAKLEAETAVQAENNASMQGIAKITKNAFLDEFS